MTIGDELLGADARIVAIRERLGRLLPQLAPGRRRPPAILLQGETGTGKGLLAQVLHQASGRCARPFVVVDCAAIPETLIEAELFGVERGAFTDARHTTPGLLRAAHGGTIFLDEIGLAPLSVQAKLLKVVEERAVRRVGNTRIELIDAVIVGATNEDLGLAIRQRRFRADLYHRLAAVTVDLAPLRERGEDVTLLAEHYLARACADHGLPPRQLTDVARAALMTYAWPGNVRELSNVMERVALLTDGPLVHPDQLGLPIGATSPTHSLTDTLAQMEREQVLAALEETDWNVAGAAARLEVARSTFRYAMARHHLDRNRPSSPPHRETARAASRAPEPAPGGPTDAGHASPSKEGRRTVVLVAATLSPPADANQVRASAALTGLIVEKLTGFGGRMVPARPAWLLAAFGEAGMEDAAGRAASAALALQKAVEHTQAGGVPALVLRVAIHQDELALVREEKHVRIPEPERGVAMRAIEDLLEMAEPSSIVAGPALAPLLERAFHVAPVSGPPTASGGAYRLLGREATGFGIGGRRLSRFQGRLREIELLQERLTQVTPSRGHVLGIVGEPGVGKSRLLYEFRESLRAQHVTYIEGRCLSWGTAVPYLPVVDLLRRWWEIGDGEAAGQVAAKVRRHVEEAGVEAPDEVVPYLLRLLGIEEGSQALATLTPEGIKRRTFDVLCHVILSPTRQQPLVLVVEDLHWVDSISQELLGALVDGLAATPALFVCTYRPGYRPPWIDRSYITQLSLPPLSAKDSLAVVRSILAPEPARESLADEIVRRAGGNAFSLEELACAARGPSHAADIGVPPTVEAALSARIDRRPAASP